MIALDLLNKLAWLNADQVKQPIAGIVLRFPGLGSTGVKSDPDNFDLEWGNAGALTVLPYHDPWGWMNPATIRFIDDLVDAIRLRYQLGPEVPLISTGGSMGGHGALLYCMRSRHSISACLALWPVCDLLSHYSERFDLPRTMHHAFGSYEDISASLEQNSPLHQVKDMPRIPYLFVHGEMDQAVKKLDHSDAMVAAMRKHQLQVEYIERAKLAHGSPMDYQTLRSIIDFVVGQLKQTN